MSDQTKSTEVVSLTAYDRLAIAEARKKELDNLSGSYVTSCQFPRTAQAGSKTIDISTIESLAYLAALAGRMLASAKEYQMGQAFLGDSVEVPVFKWGKFTVEDWQKDFQTRVRIIGSVEERKMIEDMITELRKYLGKDDAFARFDQMFKIK